MFLDPAKVTNEAGSAIGAVADIARQETLPAALEALGSAKAKVRIDAESGAVALVRRIESAGGAADVGPDPISLMKAVKNAAEIAGTRAAHRRDGAAVTRFLAWLAREAPSGKLTEIEAVEKLEALRDETGLLRELAFSTISGAGPNGAIVHYRVTNRTNRALKPGELFLLDSGAQYQDGTTDITRTVAVGEPTAEMRDRFTRVLKGHIAIARAVFPKGTSGAQLDALRAPGAVAGRARFRPRHRPRRRQLPLGARGAAAALEARHAGARAGHDPVERARLLQDRRNTASASRTSCSSRGARSPAPSARCSASRR